MPTIFTPQVDPRRKPDHSRDPGDGDHGSGQRPPTDKRTGGNGEGDDWSDRPVGSRGPRERLTQFRVGLGFSLGAILMFFMGLVTVFIVTKSNYHFDPHHPDQFVKEWVPTLVPRILWFNTAALLLSSITAEFARRSMFREQDVMDEWFGLGKPTSRRAGIWLAITLFLGTVFLAGQALAWQQVTTQPAFLRANPSNKFFYIFTVIHAIHLLLGLAGLVITLTNLHTSRKFATRQALVDTTVWYWHAMGVLWIFLFILLEFCQ
jgi:cytochrome c oxidase subunit 3